MHELERLKEILCKELYEISEKGELSAGALETVHKLTDTIKNIDKIVMLEENDGYSQDGGYDRMDGRYNVGNSYAGRRGTHYVRGHYSRESGGGSGGGYSGRGGYSRGEGREFMISHLQDMMDRAETEKEREAIRRCISQIENA